jgi:DNA-binding response OmpR family regulator
VLDWMLPDEPGVRLLARARAGADDTPVLMLTAKAREADRVEGLEVGADDYLVKPFSHAELVARLRALLRRSGVRRARALGDLEVDDDAGEARLRGERLDLTRREFELLACLVANAGRVLSRGELLDKVWGVEFSGTERTVDQHVAQLRARLGPGWIETVRGRGYRMSRAGGDR